MKKILLSLAIAGSMLAFTTGCSRGNGSDDNNDVVGKVGDPIHAGYDFVQKQWGITYRGTKNTDLKFIHCDKATTLKVIDAGNFKVEKQRWTDGKLHDTVIPLGAVN